ncbi:MAG: 4Fe-4S cluster-binding domain-containing protein, partial [Pirellulaceae bacterium]|nr:4Fe-4S cluster-binding domain-containing protein [Pirellulaceae bacterium]
MEKICEQEISPWQLSLKSAIRTTADLFDYLALSSDDYPLAAKGSDDFPLFATREFLDRIDLSNRDDPLLLQVLPDKRETLDVEGFTADSLDEKRATIEPGILQKYQGRYLVVTTQNCAIHCRYCFRKHYPYSDSPPSSELWSRLVGLVKNDRSCQEVILSGGDPLTLSDRQLQRLIEPLGKIRHLKRIRVHTRLPIMIPSRATDSLCNL